MQKHSHLPIYGVGSIYGASIIVLTVFGIVLANTGGLSVCKYGVFRPAL